MTKSIRYLQRLIDSDEDSEINNKQTEQLKSILKDKPFWIFDDNLHRKIISETDGQCCFWHIIGSPKKDGKSMPVLPYQRTLYDALESHKYLWIKKSRGIGCSEFLLRYAAFKCLTRWTSGDRVCIIVGPRINLAADLCSRFRGLTSNLIPQNDRTSSTVAFLNNVKVEAFPSYHCNTLRGLDRVKFIMSDESDFYPPFQQKEVRAVMEGFISKPNSDPTITIVSSPRAPGGLMQTIELEQNSLYHKLFFDYHHGLEGPHPIYSSKQIEIAKLSPDFPTEYEGKYLGLSGNVLSPAAIDRCISTGDTLANSAPLDNWNIATKYVASVDIGWGSSNTSIIVSRFVNGKVQIIYSKEFTRPLFQDIINEIWRIYHKCNGRENLQNILIDASATELYTALCNEFNQNSSQKYLADKQKWCKKHNTYLGDYLFICGIPFNPQGKYMLNHAQRMIEFQEDDGTAIVGINPQFDDLITSCRTAYSEGDKLLKDRGLFADSFDSLLMNLSYYQWRK